jgi:potassium-dependent mechanosensitive channel
VRRIGIRSTTIRTWQGAEVIIPNATFISDRVTNWSLSDRKRRIDLPVAVAYGTDPARVLDLLRDAALTVPGVIPEPAPLVSSTTSATARSSSSSVPGRTASRTGW